MLTEADLFDRHIQALGEAHRACQILGSQLDPEKLAPRGRQYVALKEACAALEGTCRQLNYFRSDARWLKYGMVYARILRTMQRKFVGQRWGWFKELAAVFELGKTRVAELRETKTGVLGPILPRNPSAFLVLPEQPTLAVPTHYANSGTRH